MKSSINPTSVRPAYTTSVRPTYRFIFVHRSVLMTTLVKIISPPMVGVPFFAACRSASFPTSAFSRKACFISPKRRIKIGASHRPSRNALTVAPKILNVV